MTEKEYMIIDLMQKFETLSKVQQDNYLSMLKSMSGMDKIVPLLQRLQKR